jgi:hypothetical protein
MTPHARKYGTQVSRPIPLWNGVFEHYNRIGDALWEFAWCIDRITEEREGIGVVLGGSPVKLRAVVDALKGSNRETVRRHLDKLEKEKYIRRRRTPYGHVIEVLNSRKFGIWKHSTEKPQNEVSEGVEKHGFVQEKPKSVQEKHGFVVYKEDAAETQQKDAAVAAPAGTASATETESLWKSMGSDLPMGSPKFQKIAEHYLATRNGNPLSEAMERTIQTANKRKVGVPPKFYEAKRVVERREAQELSASICSDIPVLKVESWA